MTGKTLCGASRYNRNYYFNPEFGKLPAVVQEDLKRICVGFTEEAGGIFTIEFGEDGIPRFTVRAAEGDPGFDEIGAELCIRRLQKSEAELMGQLAQFYRIFIAGKPAGPDLNPAAPEDDGTEEDGDEDI